MPPGWDNGPLLWQLCDTAGAAACWRLLADVHVADSSLIHIVVNNITCKKGMATESRYLELASVAGVEGIRSVGSKESLLAETVCVYETRLGIQIPMDSHPISLLDLDSEKNIEEIKQKNCTKIVKQCMCIKI